MSDIHEAYTSAHAYASAHDEKARAALSKLYTASGGQAAAEPEIRLQVLKAELARRIKAA